MSELRTYALANVKTKALKRRKDMSLATAIMRNIFLALRQSQNRWVEFREKLDE